MQGDQDSGSLSITSKLLVYAEARLEKACTTKSESREARKKESYGYK